MKVIFPRNIEKWRIAGVSFQIWPVRITLFQLVWLAIGAAIMLGITNAMIKNGYDRIIAIITWLPFLLIAIIIAFFEISEMNLLQFICKMMRTYVFDVPRKRQVNVRQDAPSTFALLKRKQQEKKEEVIHKRFDTQEARPMTNDLLTWLLDTKPTNPRDDVLTQ